MAEFRLAVLDDTQRIAASSADWSTLAGRAEVVFLHEPFADEDEAADRLADFDAVVAMRERTAFPASLLDRLPRLRLIALTGARAPSLDLAAATRNWVIVCNTGIDSKAATAEIALGLLLAASRNLHLADAAMRRGDWHAGVPVGEALAGKRLGILGFGRIGRLLAGYGRALGMEVAAWSRSLTDEAAREAGVIRLEREALFATSDAISIHLVLAPQTRGLVGAREIAAMRPGAILVNTARGPIVDEAALVAALAQGRIRAGLDVYDIEPLPADHPLRRLPGAVLSPHLGYNTRAVFAQVYRESLENVAAFLDGAPTRVLNPEALRRSHE